MTRPGESVASVAPMGLLELAVPMWIDRLRPLTWEQRLARRDACLAVIGYGPDDLEAIACFVTGARAKPGQQAAAFNAVAEALALGALQPGGVTFAGMHFEASR